jgi:arylsulfatase A-like enzyme
MDHPNIILIITDQQRMDTLGYLGRTPCKTPNMDRIAKEGISYEQNLCTSPLCSPSRASIFTSKYPHQLDMLKNNGTLQEPAHLTDTLREKGYYTAYAGKWHLEPMRQPKAFEDRAKELGLDKVHGGHVLPKGQRVVDSWFDDAYGQGSYDYSVWCEENGLPDGWPVSDDDVRTHRKPSMSIPKTKRQDLDPKNTYDAWVTDIALDYLRNRPKEKPFFLVTGYFGPHPPFNIPEPYYSMYAHEDIPEPPNFGPQLNEPRSNTDSYYRLLFEDHGENWEAWKKSMAVYWGYCTMMDDLVGRLLNELELEGILDETLVIFISDHGELLGSHGLWQKMHSYEEALRVPMLMRYPPKIRPGIRSQAAVSLIDIIPTILSLVGDDIPKDMLGRDLSPTFEDGEEFQEDPYRFSEHKPLGDWHKTVEWRMVTDNHFKYTWNQGDLDELYDLVDDPYELHNLIDLPEYKSEQDRLQERLYRWMVETEDGLLEYYQAEVRISL